MATETLEEKKLDEGPHLEDKEQVEATAEDKEEHLNEAEDEEVSEEEEEEPKTPEEKDGGDDDHEDKGRKKRNSKKEDGEGSLVKKRKTKGTPTSSSTEPVTPISRPSRERKSVQRYSAPSSGKVSSASKVLTIQQGSGTPLRDIPNVAFKLSKRKADENLQTLHTILFGKRSKAFHLKRNINQFSGFVWTEDEEEKQRAKIREKLDKCVKEKLLDFCEVLDIPVSKTATKKDELMVKILEFLESPHATTEVSLADKKQKTKRRKRKTTTNTGTASKDVSSKKQKKNAEAKKKQESPEATDDAEDDDEFESADTKLQSDQDETAVTMLKEESEEDNDESSDEEKKAKEVKEKKKSFGKKSMKRDTEAKVRPEDSLRKSEKNTESESSPAKSTKSPAKAIRSTEKPMKAPEKPTKGPSSVVSNKKSATDDKISDSNSKSKGPNSKNQKGNEKKSLKNQIDVPENKNTSKKEQSKSELKPSGKAGNVKVPEPSRDEMHGAVSNILKEVDFNTATLSDILRKLEAQFGMNLTHRKSEVKSIIEEVINSMTDEEDDGEEDGNGSEEEADE